MKSLEDKIHWIVQSGEVEFRIEIDAEIGYVATAIYNGMVAGEADGRTIEEAVDALILLLKTER